MPLIGNAFLCGIIAIIFSIIVAVSVLTIHNTKLFKKIINIHFTSKIIFDVIVGALCGFVYLLIYYIANIANENIFIVNTVFCVAIILPTLISLDYKNVFALNIGAITTLLIINNYILNLSFSTIIVFVLILHAAFGFLILIMSTLIRQNIYLRASYTSIFFAILLWSIVIFYSTNINFVRGFSSLNDLWIQTTILMFFTLINLWLAVGVWSVFKKIMQLNIQTQYRYKQFVGYKFAPEQISEFIARKNIQYAYVMLLHIDIENTTDKIVDYDIRKQVESIISQEISHSFKDTSALFFQTNNDRLFCIVPATNFDINSIKVSYQNNITEKRTANDPLVKFENIENKISKEIALKKQLIKPTIQIFISVYGLHDSSIQRCVELCNTLLLSKNNTNLIQIYHPVDYASQNNEMILYKELKNYVNDKNIEIQFKKIILRGETFQLPIYSYPSKNVFEYFKLLQLVPKKLTIILMRHLVALTLQAYSTNSTLSEHNIIIYYPISFIGSTEFIIQNFMNKLKLFSLLPKRVCLMIDLDQTKRLSITTIKNLQALVKNGIRIIYNNINQENINLVNTFDPWFVCYQNLINPSKSEQITYDKLMGELLTNNEIKYFSRELLSI